MKICVATSKGGLDDQICQVFGRCPTFTFVDVEDKEIKNVEVIANEFAGAMGGAGIQAAQMVANEGTNAVIAGNYGPNAYPILNQAGIKVVSTQGNVRDVIMKYVGGELPETTQPTAPRFGGMGMARGGGMGMGRGGGRRGMMAIQPQGPSQVISVEGKDHQIELLRDQVTDLSEQMKDMKKMVEELKNRGCE
jgi:predicted Fe-Mo cluster-binding NifX family protein